VCCGHHLPRKTESEIIKYIDILFELMIKILIIPILFLFTTPVSAHPGRTDSSGCHTCRTNCSSWGLSNGEYHCHRAKTATQPLEPIKSTYGENGTGYTQPATEYKLARKEAQTPQKKKILHLHGLVSMRFLG
jgi:hypothetical protein